MKNFSILLLIACSVCSYSQESDKLEPIYPSYKGLIMAGYQGWFRADGDEAGEGWGHFGFGNKFDFEHNTIDIWPDVSEYEKTYETSFNRTGPVPGSSALWIRVLSICTSNG